MKQWFSMYRNLKKEIYVLCFGRVVTGMGSLIWPMLTLILSGKLGMNASQIGLYTMAISLVMIPCNLLGGKLADRFNKKKIIICFDILTFIFFLICSFLEVSMFSMIVYSIGSVFQQMESASYDALIADLSAPQERERAFSLSYLSVNLGLVLAPTIGGILFADYLYLAFLISGFSILFSTILIYFHVKDIKTEIDPEKINIYEESDDSSLIEVLKKRKILIFYFLIASISGIIYAQFNFLIPLHLEQSFYEKSALLFGILTSVNASVVIFATPILTRLFANMLDLHRIVLGNFLEIIGLSVYIFVNSQFYVCIIAMIIFTFGEILNTISSSPYLTKRIPATHRGRILSIQGITTMVIGALGNVVVGKLADIYSIHVTWILIFVLGMFLMGCFFIYNRWDKRMFEKLHREIQ